MKYLVYLKYVIIHKWYVMLECFRYGLYWRGVWHDVSKFLPSEFLPYANYFYSGGAIKYNDAFDFAWLLHQKHNDHHWQWWCLAEDCGGVKTLPVSGNAIVEMVCDWVGAGKALGKISPKNDRFYETRKWYGDNFNKIKMNPDSRKQIEKMIGIK